MLLFLKHACSTSIREKAAISLDPGFYQGFTITHANTQNVDTHKTVRTVG